MAKAKPGWHAEAQYLYATGAMSVREIAEKVGRKYSTVYSVVTNDAAKPERIAAKARNNRQATLRRRAERRAGQDSTPEIPGLLPIWQGNEIVDFARVDLDDWRHLRVHKFTFTGKGYAQTHVSGDAMYLHHMIVGHQPRGSGSVTDHINRDALDNRRSNLRVVTQKQNCANRGGKFEKAA